MAAAIDHVVLQRWRQQSDNVHISDVRYLADQIKANVRRTGRHLITAAVDRPFVDQASLQFIQQIKSLQHPVEVASGRGPRIRERDSLRPAQGAIAPRSRLTDPDDPRRRQR